MRKEPVVRKKKKSFYETSYWYINTYNSLGSSWLIKSIEKLDLKKNYIFINLSANSGRYEKDVYNMHFDQYYPTYYIGDKEASKLKDEKEKSYEHFYYIQGDNDAVTMDISTIPVKADILLDCKGALWHTVVDKKSGKERKVQLLQLLENYSNLLKDTGVLLIDCYKGDFFVSFCHDIEWTMKGLKKRLGKVTHFGELSTYSYLVDLYGGTNINGLLEPLNIKQKIPEYPLSEIMDTAYISKDNLKKLIEKTKKMPNLKFAYVKHILIVIVIVVVGGILVSSIIGWTRG